jgi:hypothetical protein
MTAVVMVGQDNTVLSARAKDSPGDARLLTYAGRPVGDLLPNGAGITAGPHPADHITGQTWGNPAALLAALGLPEKTRLVGIGIPIESTAGPLAAPDPAARTQPAWIIAILAWEPFQRIVDDSSRFIQNLGYDTGYSYLIDADGDTVIGHVRPEFFGTSITKYHELPDLHATLLARVDCYTTYALSDDSSSKLAYLYNLGNHNAEGITLPQSLAWTLGTGVNQMDIWRDTGDEALAPLLLLIVACSVVVMSARHYKHLSDAELVDQIDRATLAIKTSDRVEMRSPELVAGPLEAALNRFLDAARERRADDASRYFTAIENPYVVGGPLHTADVFVDRETDVKWANEHLKAKGNELLCFVGPRRIGKTSILNRLKARGVGGSRVFLSAQRMLPSIRSDTSFFRLLGEAIADGLQDQSDDADLLDHFRTAASAEHLSHGFKRMPADLRPLVLLIDELQTLETCLTDGLMTDAPLIWLAGELESADVDISIVTTGSTAWTRRKKSAWRVLQPRIVDRRVSFLPIEDTVRLITAPIEKVHYSSSAVDEVIVFTGGHPYLTQATCHRVIRWLNKHHTYKVTPEVLTQVMVEIVEDPPHVLTETWRGLGSGGRVVLSACASLMDQPGRVIPVGDIVRELASPHSHGTPMSHARLRRVLEGLSAEDLLVVRQAESVAFRCDLWRRWLRHYRPVPTSQAREKAYAQQSV